MNRPGGASETELAALEEEVVRHVLDLSPGYAVFLGRHEYDGRLPELSPEATDRWAHAADRLRQRLEAIPADRLPPDRVHDRLLLDLLLESSLFDLRESHEYDRNPMAFLGSLPLTAYTSREYAPLSQRGEAMLRVVRDAPRLLRDAEARLGKILPKPFLSLSASIGEGLPGHFRESEETLRKGAPQLADEFHEASARAEELLRRFLDRLRDEYGPRATPEFALGPERFQRLLWVREGVRTPAAEVRARGLADLRRNQARLAEVARSTPGSPTGAAYLRSIGEDHPAADGILPEATRYVEESRQWILSSGIVSLPEPATCRVEETPSYGRSLSTASMNSPGPFDTTGDEGVYSVTPVDPSWSPERQEEWLRYFCRPILRNVTIHEVYPGHYLQFLHFRRGQNSLARKVYLSSSFAEGWAHYCEQLAVEEGMVHGAAAEAAQLHDALLRDCRLLASIGMHTDGMTLAQATELFRTEAHLEALPAEREAIRGSFNPEYFCYTLGKLEILAARKAQRDPKGVALRAFHDRLLSFGCPPVGQLSPLLSAA
jgi:hypothetical protein